jgi:hypothetical protein
VTRQQFRLTFGNVREFAFENLNNASMKRAAGFAQQGASIMTYEPLAISQR